MRRSIGVGGLVALAFVFSGARPADAVTITSLVGDIDCLGSGLISCPDGTFISNPGFTGTGPVPMDEARGDASGTWTHNYGVISGTVLSASLTLRVWDLGTCCGTDQVWLNGVSVFSSGDGFPTFVTRTLVIDVTSLISSSYDGTETVLFDPSDGEVWGVDFSQLDIEVAAVPEPGTLILLGSGIAGLVLRKRRKA